MTAGYGEIRVLNPQVGGLWKSIEDQLDAQAKEDLQNAIQIPEGATPYAIVARVWSTPGIESLFRMRDRMTAIGYFDENQGFVPLYYMQHQLENDFRANKHLSYRQETDEVVYRNRRHRNSKPRVYEAPGELTRDLFSALMTMRYTGTDLKQGDVLRLPTCQLEHCGELQAVVANTQNMRTSLGRKRVIQVDPTLVQPNPKKKTRGSLHILATHDAEYLPVEIRLRAFFGNFRASIESVESGSAPSKAPNDLPLFGTIPEPEYHTPSHANPDTF